MSDADSMEPEQFPILFGKVVRKLRTERNLSQEGFADLCGLHRTHMGLIERGKGGMNFSTAIKIAKTLEMPLSALIELTEGQILTAN